MVHVVHNLLDINIEGYTQMNSASSFGMVQYYPLDALNYNFKDAWNYNYNCGGQNTVCVL